MLYYNRVTTLAQGFTRYDRRCGRAKTSALLEKYKGAPLDDSKLDSK